MGPEERLQTSNGHLESRYDHQRAILGEDLFARVRQAKLLVVGAGGIGCELLKNLVLTGFQDMEVVDLDTIDVSNLNRQFLFRPEHVGQPKATVARQVVLGFDPNAKIVAHHGNVKSPEFGLAYVAKFTMVLNALDNIDARRHMNRLCLAKKIPLVDSGTTGYIGQVRVIKAGETMCYECEPKAAQKKYPICTIRSTPDKPVHCIVWAKECYKLLFGDTQGSDLYDDPAAAEESKYMHLVSDRPHPGCSVERVVQYAGQVAKGLFSLEIRSKLAVGTYKGAAQPPEPLEEAQIDQCVKDHGQAPSLHRGPGWDRQKWGLQQSLREFAHCICNIYLSADQRALVGSLDFNKDDATAMRFVTAACNLRASIFHIPLQSLYEAKGIAGNIVPAIATTNAIVAGLQVLEALKVLRGAAPVKEACKYVYCLRNMTRKGLLLQPSKLEPPSKDCFVCSASQLELRLNTTAFTLRDLVDRVLKGRLGVNEPEISIGTSNIYEEGEGGDEALRANLPKLLKDLPAGGIVDGTRICVEDFSQEVTLNISVFHAVLDELKVPELFLLEGEKHQQIAESAGVGEASADPSVATAPVQSRPPEDAAGGDDSCQVFDPNRLQKKRAREALEGSGAAKKAKTGTAAGTPSAMVIDIE